MILGFRDLIFSMTGAILDSVRPARMIWEGFPWAREIAVSAPMDLSLGPVMRTVLFG